MITVVTGHYGSGKTTLAVNLALKNAAEGRRTAVADLDFVNPFFRSADSEALFAEKGIELIAPEGANSNLESVWLKAEVDRIFSQDMDSILDVGGDDDGAVVLGRYAPRLCAAGYEMLCVMSRYRPFTAAPHDAADMIRAIEEASRLKVTALVNSSSLGEETTPETVASTADWANEISALTGIPIAYTVVEKSVAAAMSEKERSLLGKIFPVTIYTKRLF